MHLQQCPELFPCPFCHISLFHPPESPLSTLLFSMFSGYKENMANCHRKYTPLLVPVLLEKSLTMILSKIQLMHDCYYSYLGDLPSQLYRNYRKKEPQALSAFALAQFRLLAHENTIHKKSETLHKNQYLDSNPDSKIVRRSICV